MTVMASLLALFLLSSSPVISAEVSFFQESLTVSMETEDTIYVPVSISIPENGYIYSNPKGPGTGKPVSFSVNGDKILTDTVFVTEPVRHTSPLSDDWVWIHKDGLTLYIPITAGAEAAGEYTIAFDALFCDDASCTPVGDTLNLSITTGENSGILRTELPDSVLQIDLIQHDTDLQQDEEASAGTPVFTPHYIGTHTVSALFPAIIAAFVAGILLNVMPCVLPVISIKIMSLVRLHSHKRGELLLHGVTYAAGVITSFLFLASLAAFAGANWGSLFQNRIFIVAMSVIIFSLSLSLLGVYTLQTPAWISSISSSSSVVTSSFLSGLIATLLATPCSGPFLGATLAWTLTQPPGVIYAVFISIGAGLSFPFILLSLFPSLLSSLPKGGRWSVAVGRALGFLLAGSVIYFLSTIDETYIIMTLIILLFTAIGLWQFGKFHVPVSSQRTRLLSRSGLVLAVLIGVFTARFLVSGSDRSVPPHEEFSYDKLESYVASGTLVFVQFTADWCPNCTYLERTVLHTDSFASLMDTYGIVYMKADLTGQATSAEKFLLQLGSRSIPYAALFYPGSFTTPVALRDMFSQTDLTRALTKAVERAKSEDTVTIEPITF